MNSTTTKLEVKTPVRIDNYIFDERFYRWTNEKGEDVYYPSVTYILGCAYPSDFGLTQWRGDVGNKRADEILEESAADGSYVHDAIKKILEGEQIERSAIEMGFLPRRALKVMRCLKAFLDWYTEYKPQVLATEYIVWNEEHKFAGTVDLRCKIGEDTYIVDFKTGKSLHESHKAQICAYGLADPADKVALLHLGNTTKKKYSFNVLDDDERKQYMEEFNQTNKLFRTLNPNAKPNEETFPDVFILG